MILLPSPKNDAAARGPLDAVRCTLKQRGQFELAGELSHRFQRVALSSQRGAGSSALYESDAAR